MSYFTQEFLDFYIELSRNNNKEWFHANKKRYEAHVKEPFLQLLGDLIQDIQQYDSSIKVTPKECIYRVNRDIRFSQDKSPYKLHVSGTISAAGKSDKGAPGFHLEFSPEIAGIYGGCYCMSKEQIYNLRKFISTSGNTVNKLISNEEFLNAFGEIQGEENKIIPKEFKAAFEQNPLIAKKQFYYTNKQDISFIMRDSLREDIMNYYLASKPVHDFLVKATK